MKDELEFIDINFDDDDNEKEPSPISLDFGDDVDTEATDTGDSDIEPLNIDWDRIGSGQSSEFDEEAATEDDDDFLFDENTNNVDMFKEDVPPKQVNIVKEIISYVSIVAVAFILAFVITHFWIVNARIPTGSMIPTVEIGDRIIGNRLAYMFSEPERGDVIVFYYPDNEEKKYLKRIIGLPGETVTIEDHTVYINGEPLDESAYLKEEMTGNFGPYVVPDNCYFVMGDNRNSSWDSRYWTHTYVSRDKIIAEAVFSYYPSIHTIK